MEVTPAFGKELAETDCVGCGQCRVVCPTGAITVTNNVAHIDPAKCTNCGLCKEKCPKKIIL